MLEKPNSSKILSDIIKSRPDHELYTITIQLNWDQFPLRKVKYCIKIISILIIGFFIYWKYRRSVSSSKWHTKFHDIDIKYIQDLPSEEEWNLVKPNSLVVLDDLFVEAVNSEAASKSFKIYSKKRNFSIIVVSQVRFLCSQNLKFIRNSDNNFICPIVYKLIIYNFILCSYFHKYISINNYI